MLIIQLYPKVYTYVDSLRSVQMLVSIVVILTQNDEKTSVECTNCSKEKAELHGKLDQVALM